MKTPNIWDFTQKLSAEYFKNLGYSVQFFQKNWEIHHFYIHNINKSNKFIMENTE